MDQVSTTPWGWNTGGGITIVPVDTGYCSTQACAAVPEIDASMGALAIAAVLALTALAWEIKRRRSV
ncbi:VPEID-CTERM sorting domain-containing protein [Pseudaestuariivita sp.]|uniref:VPEID-CTERM sorting domain-containing protein n=1 Tax=Pseudaestuariivita sp. TaxID=2211669 RepID=UPI0040594351